MANNLVPKATNVGNLGKPAKIWNTVYANNVGTTDNQVETIHAKNVYADNFIGSIAQCGDSIGWHNTY